MQINNKLLILIHKNHLLKIVNIIKIESKITTYSFRNQGKYFILISQKTTYIETWTEKKLTNNTKLVNYFTYYI